MIQLFFAAGEFEGFPEGMHTRHPIRLWRTSIFRYRPWPAAAFTDCGTASVAGTCSGTAALPHRIEDNPKPRPAAAMAADAEAGWRLRSFNAVPSASCPDDAQHATGTPAP
ncbi:MAG: hypothetical protein MZV70_44180 [Desulfobacterales bacterium]|nr:hypothetical protein [Desulfobacterales bacterium]